MNPEIKVKWLEALRSGKYKQGKGLLFCKELNRYCCLGVLCDVMGTLENHDALAGFMNDSDRELAGLKDENVFVDMNDYGHHSFIEIADYIEKNL